MRRNCFSLFATAAAACCAIVAVTAQSRRAQPRLPPPVRDTLPKTIDVTHVPAGLPKRVVPVGNPLTEARVVLGRRLFFDGKLSGDGRVTCASCHRPEHGFAA
ncbi:MAG: cytochrome c peroxidase, partial [Planctomycetaceae bacterium]